MVDPMVDPIYQKVVVPIIVLLAGIFFSILTMIFSFKSQNGDRAGYGWAAFVIFVVTIIATSAMMR